jgi:RNA polymerase sigma-70 factor (ECF subfamily)
MVTEAPAPARLAAAQAGDPQAFSDLVEPYRAELLLHCYRLLGSIQDAEDMVQETYLRSWNALGRFNGGPYFRAWLYKIATNVCLDALDKRARRVLSPANFPPTDPSAGIAPAITEPIWLEPFPDARLPDARLSEALGPEARYSLRESISLAFLAAMQWLPPRQRVILILCDVLDWRAREVAQLLEITVAAVNGLLRRARATMAGKYRARAPAGRLDTPTRSVLSRYVAAWEAGDVEGLVALLSDQPVFAMPPSPTWYLGRDTIRRHAQVMFALGSAGRWRLRPTAANGQIAFASYRLDDRDGLFYAHALQVLSFVGDQLAEMQMFLIPALFPPFGLASAISA